jgi:hypothetical protein
MPKSKPKKEVLWANQYVDYNKLSPIEKKAFNICRDITYNHAGIPPYIDVVQGVKVWAQDGKDLKKQVLEILRKRK